MANIKQRNYCHLLTEGKYGTANINDRDCSVCVGVGIWEGSLLWDAAAHLSGGRKRCWESHYRTFYPDT